MLAMYSMFKTINYYYIAFLAAQLSLSASSLSTEGYILPSQKDFFQTFAAKSDVTVVCSTGGPHLKV